jgi:uncharacterized membrane protein
MVGMEPKVFLSRLEDQKIVSAIQKAEHESSGEIRLYVSEKQATDVLEDAKVHFFRLGMEKTRGRNAVLIFFAPRSRAFSVVGDVGIHERCGEGLWQEVASVMQSHLQREEFTDALVAGIERVGAVLARHFPRQSDDQNELPDEVAGD